MIEFVKFIKFIIMDAMALILIALPIFTIFDRKFTFKPLLLILFILMSFTKYL